MRKFIGALLALIVLCAPAHAQQYIQQSGSVTPGHLGSFVTSGVMGDAGTPANPKVNALGIYNGSNTPFCINNTNNPGPPVPPYSMLCLYLSHTQAQITLQSKDEATPAFSINIGGMSYPFPGTVTGTTSVATPQALADATSPGTSLVYVQSVAGSGWHWPPSNTGEGQCGLYYLPGTTSPTGVYGEVKNTATGVYWEPLYDDSPVRACQFGAIGDGSTTNQEDQWATAVSTFEGSGTIGTPVVTLPATYSTGFGFTTTADSPAGHLNVVTVLNENAPGELIPGVTDSAGNVYTLAAQSPSTAGVYGSAIFYSSDTADDLPSGGTITVLGATVAVTSGTPSTSGEFFVGWGTNSSGVSFSQSSGWNTSPFSTGTGAYSATGAMTNAGSGTVSYDPTMTNGGAWADILVAFKPSSGSQTVTDLGNNNGDTTASVTASSGVTSGGFIVVLVTDCSNSNDYTNGSLTDSSGNTYHLAKVIAPGGFYQNCFNEIWYAYNVTALTDSSTITFADPQSSFVYLNPASVTGILATSDPLDSTATTATFGDQSGGYIVSAASVANANSGLDQSNGAVSALPSNNALVNIGSLPTVTDVGNNYDAGTSVTLQPSLPIADTSDIVVLVYDGSTTNTSAETLTDTEGNTYHLISSEALDNDPTIHGFLQIWDAYDITPLSTSDTITLSDSAASANGLFLDVAYTTGIVYATDPLDNAATASAYGASGVGTVTSGTPSQAGDLFIGYSLAAPVQPTTQSLGWSSLFSTGANGGIIVNSGTGTETYAPTGGSGVWVNLITALKASPVLASSNEIAFGLTQTNNANPPPGYTLPNWTIYDGDNSAYRILTSNAAFSYNGTWPIASFEGTDNFPAIQGALDYAMQSGYQTVCLNDGSYLTSDTLQLGYGEKFRTINLVYCGGGRPAYSNGSPGNLEGATIIPENTDRCAVNIQGGRNSGIKGIAFYGQNGTHVGAVVNAAPGTPYPDYAAGWLDPALTETASGGLNVNSPYAAICQDAYSGSEPSDPYPTVNYPSWTGIDGQYSGLALSSNTLIQDVYIAGFGLGINLDPNSSGNGDFAKLDKITCDYDTYCISSAQDESRNVLISNIDADGYFTVITNNSFGDGEGKFGGPMTNISADNGYAIFDLQLSYDTSADISDLYCETCVMLGWFGSPAFDQNSVIIDNAELNFSDAGTGVIPPYYAYGYNSNVSFDFRNVEFDSATRITNLVEGDVTVRFSGGKIAADNSILGSLDDETCSLAGAFNWAGGLVVMTPYSTSFNETLLTWGLPTNGSWMTSCTGSASDNNIIGAYNHSSGGVSQASKGFTANTSVSNNGPQKKWTYANGPLEYHSTEYFPNVITAGPTWSSCDTVNWYQDSDEDILLQPGDILIFPDYTILVLESYTYSDGTYYAVAQQMNNMTTDGDGGCVENDMAYPTFDANVEVIHTEISPPNVVYYGNFTAGSDTVTGVTAADMYGFGPSNTGEDIENYYSVDEEFWGVDPGTATQYFAWPIGYSSLAADSGEGNPIPNVLTSITPQSDADGGAIVVFRDPAIMSGRFPLIPLPVTGGPN